jgi:hypothetical protein
VAKARTERDAAQKAYNVADAGLEPLRAAKEAAAAALAGRLDGLVAEAEAVALAADARAEEAEQQGRDAADRRRQAEADLGDARRDLAGIDATVKAADAARAAAVEDGWLLSGERPDRCERRWSERRTAHDAEADRQDALATAAEETFDALGMTIEAIDRDLVGQRAAADHARRRLAAFDAELAALAADETVFGRSAMCPTARRRWAGQPASPHPPRRPPTPVPLNRSARPRPRRTSCPTSTRPAWRPRARTCWPS